MRQPSPLAAALAVLAAGAVATAAAASPDGPERFHERKEVAGLAIVFGAEPEPALTEEMQFLRWRVSALADQEPYGDLQDAEVVVRRDGREYGPFRLQPVRQQPGLYQTRHIFTAAGEYDSQLRFRKGEEREVHSVDFAFTIRDRSELELPPRRRGGR